MVKTYEIYILTERGDITWYFVTFVIWAALEINLVIITASAPTLKPFFANAKKRSSSSPTYQMYNYGGSANVSSGAKGRSYRGNSSGNSSKPGDLQRSISQEKILEHEHIVGVTKTWDVEISRQTYEGDGRPELRDVKQW